jgi:imidazolonepropionase-like amidohydrolase
MRELAVIAFVLTSITTAPTEPLQRPTPSSSQVAFIGVNVIPMDRETVLRDQTVVVDAGRIVSIGPRADTKVPSGSLQISAAGKFLLPALSEMHAHIPGGKEPDAAIERTLFYYAANGIGTIRGMLGDPRHLTYRERVAKGELISPRIYTSGPSLNGNSVPTRDAAVQAVTDQKAAGYDLLKIHPGIERDVFDALAAKAHDLRIDFAGHVPLAVGLHRALEARYRSIDHLDGYIEALSKTPMQSQFFGINLVADIDESKISALVEETRKAGTWMVPTQVLLDNLLSDEDPYEMAKRPEMKYQEPQAAIQKWIAQKQSFLSKAPAADRAKFLRVRRTIIKALYDAGVPFALGSDAPQMWNVPGFASHRELQSMVRAGLTPYQALRTATVDVGTYFGMKDSGAIANGHRANLLLVDANPLQDITNTTKIAGVLIGGKWLPREELDKRLNTSADP